MMRSRRDARTPVAILEALDLDFLKLLDSVTIAPRGSYFLPK
jgi:hypothetical protein